MRASREKLITERIQESERVIALAREHAEDLAARVNTLCGQGAMGVDLVALVEAQANLLQEANGQLLRAWERFEVVSAEQGGIYANEQAASALEHLLWYAQGRIAEPYGPETLELYGLEESPPVGHRALATYAHNTVTLLRAQPQTLPGRFDDHLETERIAQLIDEPLRALDDYLVTLDNASATFKNALSERDAAADHWMRVWRGASTVLSGLFLLGGRAELAARVRPTLPGLCRAHDLSALLALEIDEIEHTSRQIL